MVNFLKYLSLLSVICVSQLMAEEKDAGKQTVGKLNATLYIGTDGDVKDLGDKVQILKADVESSFRAIEKMKFASYRKLGSDTQPVLRSYENWLAPLKPAEEILISYESKGLVADDGLRLDLELWQQKRKIMKSDQVLKLGKPLLILGPKWRGGTLIISIELVNISPQK